MQPIQRLSVLPLPHVVRAANGLPAGSAGGPSFKDVLADSLGRLGAAPQQAPGAAGNSVSGGENAMNMLLATQRADSTMQSALQVGNRLAAAYDEIKNLRI
jgi:flagellar hook-basal body complex protein FliE